MSASVTGSLCLSQTVCVCHRQSMSVWYNLCLSQAVCVWHRHSSWSFLAWFSLIYTWFSPRFVREIWICPAFKHHQHQFCGPLPAAGTDTSGFPKDGKYVIYHTVHVCYHYFLRDRYPNHESSRAEILREYSPTVTGHMPGVMCHLSRNRCQVSSVTCQVSGRGGLSGGYWELFRFELPACYHLNLGIFWGVWLSQNFFLSKIKPYPGRITFWKYNGKSIFWWF